MLGVRISRANSAAPEYARGAGDWAQPAARLAVGRKRSPTHYEANAATGSISFTSAYRVRFTGVITPSSAPRRTT